MDTNGLLQKVYESLLRIDRFYKERDKLEEQLYSTPGLSEGLKSALNDQIEFYTLCSVLEYELIREYKQELEKR